jgi:F-type H+-transporting ATPase subunit gamma
VVVVGGARGLCGSYNVVLLRAANDHVKSIDEELRLLTVGQKARVFFDRQRREIHLSLTTPDEAHRILQAREISRVLQGMYLRGEVGQVDFVYTEFLSAIRQHAKVRQFLPIEPAEQDDDNGGAHAASAIFEPPAEELLNTLLPRALDSMVYEMLLQSATSEEGARMAAMSAATENAAEMRRQLTQGLNRARQALITGEILEIVSGANALMEA